MHALRPLRVVFRAARGGRVAVLAVVEARQPGIQVVLYGLDAAAAAQVAVGARSEEHTSELQSLMRISYAVFCLKKKTHNIKTSHQTTQHLETNQTRKTVT